MKLLHYSMKMRSLLIIGLVMLLTSLHISSINADEMQATGYKLQLDNDGLGSDDGQVRSADQSNQYLLSGALETFDNGVTNTSGAGAGNYLLRTGLLPTFESHIAEVATLTNSDASVVLYDRLLFVIDPNENSTDANGAQFAVQIDTTAGFTNPRYINVSSFEPDNVTNSNLATYYAPCAQTNNQPADALRWNCGNVANLKRYIKGLGPDMTYYVRVITYNGDFTNSPPGPSVQATTGDISMTFSVSQTTSSFGILHPGSVNTSNVSSTLSAYTNWSTGYTVRVRGVGDNTSTESGLYSASKSVLIPSTAGNLSSNPGQKGYGLQANIANGTPFIDTAWDPSQPGRNASYVGQILRSNKRVFYSSGPQLAASNHSTSISYHSTISFDTPAASDYQDTLTYTMIVNP